MAHAKLPPSSAHRWIKCPGSVAFLADVQSTDSVFSREGTFVHDVAAKLLATPGRPATDMLGHTDGEFEVDPEMAGHVQTYLDVVDSLVLLHDGELRIEQKVVFTDEIWGTADALVWSPRRLDIVDLKYGAGKFVDVLGNDQCMTYAIAALTSSPKGVDVDTIGLHIVQPRCLDADGAAHRHYDIDRKQLAAFGKMLIAAARATEDPNAPLVAGDHCGFCEKKGECPAFRDRALKAAQAVFPSLDVTKPVRPPHPTTYSPADLGSILRTLDHVDTWTTAMREHAFEQAMNGVKIPGYKLVEKIGNRKWLDEDKAAAALREIRVDPFESFVVSPAAAEKRKAPKALVDKLTYRPITGKKLVPESAKGAELNRNPFTDLDQLIR